MGVGANHPGAKVTISICSKDEWNSIQPLWNEFAEGSPYTSFFLSSDWVDTWINTFNSYLKIEILRFTDNGVSIGFCLLNSCKRTKRLIPINSIFLNTSGEKDSDSVCSEYNNILCLKGWESKIAHALFSYLMDMNWDELCIAGYHPSKPLTHLINRFGNCRIQDEIRPSYFVDLLTISNSGNSYDTYLPAGLKKDIFRSMKLYQRNGELKLETPNDIQSALAALDELAALHQVRWTARGKPGAFASPLFVEFHKNLVRRLFPKGNIQIIRVRAGSQVIGILYDFVYKNKVYFYQSGFRYTDDNRLKPGLVTLFLGINFCLERGMSEYDFLAGEARYKKSLATDSRPLHWITIRRKNLKMFGVEMFGVARRSWMHIAHQWNARRQ